MTETQKILGGNGCRFIDAASTNNRFFCLVVNSACVLTNLKTVGQVDLLLQYGLTGKTLNQGTVIPMFNGDPIADVTPSSGNLIGYGYREV